MLYHIQEMMCEIIVFILFSFDYWIYITLFSENNQISIYNNGKGIPVVMHKGEKMYVPTMIFGHLLTSSNYNDEEQKVTGGRNGYGAKLCNIFSTKFTVETASEEYMLNYKQVSGDINIVAVKIYLCSIGKTNLL